jgi:DNA polymerase III epsilon subunit family exonuclease
MAYVRDTKIRNDCYVVVDIETTGLYPTSDEIIEIGAIKVDQNGEIHTFQKLIKPCNPVSAFITNLTGITNQMLAEEGNDITKVLQEFDEFIEDYTLIGHNVLFDIRFIDDKYEKYLLKNLENKYLDTLYLARRYLPMLANHKLNTVATHLHIDASGHHRALADVKMTLGIYLHLQNYK